MSKSSKSTSLGRTRPSARWKMIVCNMPKTPLLKVINKSSSNSKNNNNNNSDSYSDELWKILHRKTSRISKCSISCIIDEIEIRLRKRGASSRERRDKGLRVRWAGKLHSSWLDETLVCLGKRRNSYVDRRRRGIAWSVLKK